jgi:hypothetical protein
MHHYAQKQCFITFLEKVNAMSMQTIVFLFVLKKNQMVHCSIAVVQHHFTER